MIVNPRDSADSFRLLEIRAKRQRRARELTSSFSSWSLTRNLIWHLQDISAMEELNEPGPPVSDARRLEFLHHDPENQ